MEELKKNGMKEGRIDRESGRQEKKENTERKGRSARE